LIIEFVLLKFKIKHQYFSCNFGVDFKLQKLDYCYEWSEKKLLVPPDDDGIFCGGFDYVEEGTTLIDLRIFVTTKHLLSYMRISRRESECILFLFFTLFSMYS
jgi:hypothetical protein